MGVNLKWNLLGFLCLLSAFSFPIWSQPYAIGHTTLNFVDPSRGNRSIATEIYYPSDSNGDNVPVTTATTETFPVLVFGHGFVMGWDAYSNIWGALVPKGYIMAFPKTEGGLSPSHAEFGKDLAFVVTQMHNLGTLSGSILFGRVGLTDAVMGHSMGGGAAFLAAQYNVNIKSIVTLAAAETTPSAIAAASSLTLPALVVAGGNDCVTPPGANQVAMYNALGSACKTYLEIVGGSHCQMANNNFLCNFGEATCTPTPAITREQQHAVLEPYLGLWLDAQLKLNCDAGAVFNSTLTSDSSITFEKNCIQCEPLSTAVDQKKNRVGLSPNPFSAGFHISNQHRKHFSFTLFDSRSRVLLSKRVFAEQDFVNTSSLASGLYWYEILADDGYTQQGKLLKN